MRFEVGGGASVELNMERSLSQHQRQLGKLLKNRISSSLL